MKNYSFLPLSSFSRFYELITTYGLMIRLYKVIILAWDMIKDILALSLTMEIYCTIYFGLQIMLLIEILFTFKHRITYL